VNANSPLPTDKGESGSKFLRTGSCLETKAKRSMMDGFAGSLPDPIFDNALLAIAAPMNVRRVILDSFN
jgi:hypothetical protein